MQPPTENFVCCSSAYPAVLSCTVTQFCRLTVGPISFRVSRGSKFEPRLSVIDGIISISIVNDAAVFEKTPTKKRDGEQNF